MGAFDEEVEEQDRRLGADGGGVGDDSAGDLDARAFASPRSNCSARHTYMRFRATDSPQGVPA